MPTIRSITIKASVGTRGRNDPADVLDPECCGWSLAGLNEALDLVPGSRAAFRALGWAV